MTVEDESRREVLDRLPYWLKELLKIKREVEEALRRRAGQASQPETS